VCAAAAAAELSARGVPDPRVLCVMLGPAVGKNRLLPLTFAGA